MARGDSQRNRYREQQRVTHREKLLTDKSWLDTWKSKYNYSDPRSMQQAKRKYGDLVEQLTSDAAWGERTGKATSRGDKSYSGGNIESLLKTLDPREAREALEYYKATQAGSMHRGSQDALAVRQAQQEKAAIAKAQGNDMMVGNLPVIVGNDGKLHYDLDAIGSSLGMSKEDIGTARSHFFGQKYLTDPIKQLETAAGIKDWKSQQLQQHAAAASTVRTDNPNLAVLSNLAEVNPAMSPVDTGSKDQMYHLSRPGFVGRAGGYDDPMNVMQSLDRSIKPGWGEKYGTPIVTALAKAGATFINPAVGAAMSTFIDTAQSEGPTTLASLGKNAGLNVASAALPAAAGWATQGIANPLLQRAARVGLHGASEAAIGTAAEGGTGADFLTRAGANVAAGGITAGIIEGIGMLGDQLGTTTPEIAADSDMEVAPAQDMDAAELTNEPMTSNLAGGLRQQWAPTALELGASPGDIGGAGQQYQQSDLAGELYDPSMIGGFEGLHYQFGESQIDPTGQGVFDRGGQAQWQEPINQSPTGAAGELTQSNLNWEGAPGTEESSGFSGAEVQAQQDYQPTIEELGGPYRSMDHDPYSAEPIQAPIMQEETLTPFDALAEAYTGGDIPGVTNPYANFIAGYDLTGRTQRQTGREIEPRDPREFLSHMLGSALYAVPGMLGGQEIDYQDPFAGASRQQVTGIDTTAGQADPESSQQIEGIGTTAVNPALFSQIDDGALDPEERKRREQMWMDNPLM